MGAVRRGPRPVTGDPRRLGKDAGRGGRRSDRVAGDRIEAPDRSWAARHAPFLLSLAANLGSYWTAEYDMEARLAAPKAGGGYEVAERSDWTKWTELLNAVASLGLVAGGVALAFFIRSSA
jgi:hypothetical protein